MLIDYLLIYENKRTYEEHPHFIWSTYCVLISFPTLYLFKSYNFQEVMFMFTLVDSKRGHSKWVTGQWTHPRLWKFENANFKLFSPLETKYHNRHSRGPCLRTSENLQSSESVWKIWWCYCRHTVPFLWKDSIASITCEKGFLWISSVAY